MTLENGTLILADYTGRVKDTGQIIDTTRKNDAEKAGNADPTKNYEPRLIAIGEGWVLKGLDEALAEHDPGQSFDIEIAPDKAFGPRDPTKVSRMPLRKFGDKASELEVGEDIEVDNRVGIVRAVESGRVFVDFNHRYSGKTLEYNVEIKEKLASKDAKIEALIRRRLPIEKEKIKFENVNDNEVRIIIPNDYFLLEGLQIIKRAISNDLFKFIKPINRVEFVENYENPAAKKEPIQAEVKSDVTTEESMEKVEEGKPSIEESGKAAMSAEAIVDNEPQEPTTPTTASP